MQAMNEQQDKWNSGLKRTRKSSLGKVAAFFGATEISDEVWDDLESTLIQADLGVETSLSIIESTRQRVLEDGVIRVDELKTLLADQLYQRLLEPPLISFEEELTVILIAGVNGSGKTTTIAKLGGMFQNQGHRVHFIAGDTFRAAAVEQLESWGEKLGISVTRGQQDGDPGAVVFDGIQSAQARSKTIALIDTAGRLHTRYNLMAELKKVHRVAGKALSGAPHFSWLVMDATTGQNALHQAEAFNEAIPLSGIILAKLDTSAKGGMAFAIQDRIGLPILYAGLGEKPDDLVRFDPRAFVNGILENN
jgi:fused signal recognition particle receptor